MSLIEEKTLADHDINVRSIRQELQLLEEQLKKHGRNEIHPSLTATDLDTVSRQPEPHWIPCSERLPECEVLCCDKRGEMIIGYPYQDDESETGYSAVLDDVYMIDCIAWMEKPEPYREDI